MIIPEDIIGRLQTILEERYPDASYNHIITQNLQSYHLGLLYDEQAEQNQFQSIINSIDITSLQIERTPKFFGLDYSASPYGYYVRCSMYA